MTERRRYKNPPIEQAICEFRFAPERAWDPTLAGRLPGIRLEYDGQVQELRQLEWTLSESGTLSPALTFKEGPPRVRFESKGAHRAVEISPSILSVQASRPYIGWFEDFRPRVHAAFGEFCEVTKPDGVVRIGIRYINRIRLADRLESLAVYFRYLPQVPSGIPQGIAKTQNRSQFNYGDGTKLLLTFAGAEIEGGATDVVLDLDMSWESSGECMPLADALTTADDLRRKERDAFEAIITDEARRIFDA